jgi:hypothetical protein
MRLDRGLLFWRLALITTGAVALAVELGYVEHHLQLQPGRQWPDADGRYLADGELS